MSAIPILVDPLRYYERETRSDLASEMAIPRELRSKYSGPSAVEIWERRHEILGVHAHPITSEVGPLPPAVSGL